MLDILTTVGIDVHRFLLLLSICAFIVPLLYGPFVMNLLDPLIMFITATIADAVLMFGLDWPLADKIEFTEFVLLFWLGFALAGRTPAQNRPVALRYEGLVELDLVLQITTLLIVLGNIYLGFTVGFPLFSDLPSEAKVNAYNGGLGFIRHLNQGPFTFVCCGCTLLIALGHKTGRAIVMLIACCACMALSGSKGALLPMLFVQGFVARHRGLTLRGEYARKLKKLIPLFIAASVAVAVAVLTHENGGFVTGQVSLAKRLLFFGDTILFYYPRRGVIPELASVGPLDYLHYLFDPLLGMFRVLDYRSILPPLGSVISNSEPGLGPNAQYFVRADIFFGPVLGAVYCFFLGQLTGCLRNQFFRCVTDDAMVLTISLTLAVSAISLPFESSLFVSMIADCVFLILPLWCFARVTTLATTEARDVEMTLNV